MLLSRQVIGAPIWPLGSKSRERGSGRVGPKIEGKIVDFPLSFFDPLEVPLFWVALGSQKINRKACSKNNTEKTLNSFENGAPNGPKIVKHVVKT